MPQSDWLTEKDKSTYIGNEALADFKHKMAKMQAEIQRGVDAHASKAAIRDANTKGQQKDAKEKQAAKQKSQSTDEPVTKNLPTNSVANVKGSSQQGSTQDLTTMLPPTGEAPPFLMDHSRQTSLGMEALDPVVSAPVRRTVDRTNVKPNVLTAAQAQSGEQNRAYNMARLQQQAQKDMVSNVIEISGVTGDLGVAARAAGQFQQGDTVGAFNTLSKFGKTLPAQVLEARIAASNSTYNKNQLIMSKTKREILRIEGELANLPIERAGKIAGLMKSLGELREMDDEHAKIGRQSISDRYGYPSSRETNQLTDNEMLIRTKELFGPPGGVLSSIRGNKLDPTRQANLDMLQVENFNRGNILTASGKESKLTPTEQALSWMDSVFEYQSGRDDSEGAKSAHDTAVKSLVELGLSRGTVMNQDELKAGRVTPDLWLSPDDDNFSNSTSANLLFKHWIYKRTGSEEVSEDLESLQQETRRMIQELMSGGTR